MDPWMLGFGALLLFTGFYFMRHNRETRARLEDAADWPRVDGTVLSSEVKRKPGSDPVFEGRVEYRFVVDGETYTSRAIAIGGELRGPRTRVERLIEPYPEGAEVEVFYDPADPTRCCLERRHEGGWLEILGGAFGIVAGAALLVGAFL